MRKWMNIAVLTVIFVSIIMSVQAEKLIVIEYFYSETCGKCEEYTEFVEQFVADYEEKVLLLNKPIGNRTYRGEWLAYNFTTYPCAMIEYETAIPKNNMSYETLEAVVTEYILRGEAEQNFDEDIVIPFFGKLNYSGLSLPILTITLGALDSFNPCSFFILIILLSLLIHLSSRRRMLLVGGIFIFFSGLFYFVFIFLLFESLILTAEHIMVISLFAGFIAMVIGVLNIKDFFSKTGVSLSMSDEKKSDLFRKMRNLVKTTYLPSVLVGTVVLAVTINFYELLCTLGFPFVFSAQLALYSLSDAEYFSYIFLYIVVYVIPLIVILMIFTFTLGRWRLSEWQGRMLKLLSGLMIFSFGVLFIVDYTVLQTIEAPILLLVGSVVATFVVSYCWKLLVEKKKEDDSKKQ